jgi:dUTP pyrophosphatase
MNLKLLHPQARIPARKTTGAAGNDLFAVEKTIIKPYELGAKVRLGIALELPQGMEMEIRGRSGMNTKTSLRVIQGTIDWDYRGEVQVIFDNISDDEHTIRPGDRIAQGVFKYVALPVLIPTFALSETKRAGGGFGHTGK